MKKNEFKFLKCHCDDESGVLVLVIKEHKNYESIYVGNYIRFNTGVYRVSFDCSIIGNIVMLVCHKVSEITIRDFDFLFKYDVTQIDKYFIDDIKKLIKKD